MKAPEFLHNWLASFTGPGWKWHAEKSASLERNARIKEMLEKEKTLKEMAEREADAYFATLPCKTVKLVKFGGPGTCPTCGEIVPNLALHAARCGKWDYFGNPVLDELAKADREGNIIVGG